MPTSAQENKQTVKVWIDDLNPRRVLDVGVGEGTYSTLARKEGQTWYGIEAYYPYIKEYDLNDKYDVMVVGDARYIDYGKLPRFQLAIIGDCIEHMTKKESMAVMNELLQHSAHLLVSFPVLHLQQADVGGNEFERHIDHWTLEGMRAFLGDRVIKSTSGNILAYFLAKGE